MGGSIAEGEFAEVFRGYLWSQRVELKQLKLRSLSDLLEFIVDDSESPTADDFAQVVAVHKSVNEKQSAIVAEIVVSQRVKKNCFRRKTSTHILPPPFSPPWRGAPLPQLSVSRTARGYRGPRLRAGGSLPCREA